MVKFKLIFNKLMSVFYASVLLLIMNFIITLSKELWIYEAIATIPDKSVGARSKFSPPPGFFPFLLEKRDIFQH